MKKTKNFLEAAVNIYNSDQQKQAKEVKTPSRIELRQGKDCGCKKPK